MVHCSSVQQASSYYPTAPPRGRAQLSSITCTPATTNFKTKSWALYLIQHWLVNIWLPAESELLMGYWMWFKRKRIKERLLEKFALALISLTVLLFDAGSNSLIVAWFSLPLWCKCVAYSVLSPRLRPGHRRTQHSDLGSIILAARLPELTDCKPQWKGVGRGFSATGGLAFDIGLDHGIHIHITCILLQ